MILSGKNLTMNLLNVIILYMAGVLISCSTASKPQQLPQPSYGINHRLELKTYPNNQTIKERYIREGLEVVFQCRDEGVLRVPVRWTRPGGRPLPPGSKDQQGRLEIPNIRLEHSGEYICEAVGVPSSTPGAQVGVHLPVERRNLDWERPQTACSSYEATCMNGQCIPKHVLCNGYKDCADGSDESSCRAYGQCQPNEFKYGENDCEDGSDEQDCNGTVVPGSQCSGSEYECRSGQCIPKTFECDSHRDCIDGSDEIGCIKPTVVQPPPPSVYLQPGETFNITCRAIGVPTPLVSWRLNLGHIPEKCTTTSHNGYGVLTCSNIGVEDSGAYSCELLNNQGTKFVVPETILSVPVSNCDPRGTLRQHPDGRCECKEHVTGSRCDQCSSHSFFLNPRWSTGCIECFCNGVSQTCTSSSLYRDSVRPTFAQNRHEFTLITMITDYENPQESDLDITTYNNEVSVHDLAGDTDIYFWRLPSHFAGNKITSYGGNLKYSIRYKPTPGGSMSRNNAPDVVIRSANDITILHHRRDEVAPNSLQSYVVPILEESWQRLDGITISREKLLMILADVSDIFIKATYTTTTGEAALSQVILDTASQHYTGNNVRASEVEQCSCPLGHQGYSCEDCAPGYKRSQGGLYLGLCEPCDCNGHSDECDGETSVCHNCRNNTEGDRCERCANGYNGDATRGTQYDCSTDESHGNQTTCPPNVVGHRCDQCRQGTYNYDRVNPLGCTECFCSGVTRTCSASRFYRQQIQAIIFEDKFPLTNRFGEVQTNEDPAIDFATNKLSNRIYNGNTYYWSLPQRFLGNQLKSYGGYLSFGIGNEAYGTYIPDQDIIIRGNRITLVWTRFNPNENRTEALFKESDWQSINEGGSKVASRADLLIVLSNLEAILVRATLKEGTSLVSLSDVALDTAVQQNTDQDLVRDIEICRCPEGYTGSSCESCDHFYYRDANRSASFLGTCNRCPCENADSCTLESNGNVLCHCHPGYVGDRCTVPDTPIWQGNVEPLQIFYDAAKNGDVQKIEQLIRIGVDTNIRNQRGMSPLVIAASYGHTNVVELLIRNGADINLKNKNGKSAIFAAAYNGHRNVVEILIKNGADVNIINEHGSTPIYAAAHEGHEEVVEVLVRNGADVNIQGDGGRSTLHWATEKGFEKIVEILMRNGANVDLKDNKNDTSMTIAIRKGNTKIIEILKTIYRRPSEKACKVYTGNRILNGELVEDGEFPWMVALGYLDANSYKPTFDCGGTIISDSFILTAAHCVKPRPPVKARMGKVSLIDTDEDDVRAINRRIRERDIIAHPQHSSLTKMNDIALIRIRDGIPFSEYIKPACLETDYRDKPTHFKLIVAGWGLKSDENRVRSDRLLKTQLMTMPLSECISTVKNWNRRVDHATFRNGLIGGQYCAYDPHGRNDSCDGDSGGPLQYFATNKTSTVVGIVSFGVVCGAPNFPSFYTRVAYYLDWIEDIVWPGP
ncbi:basement membrane proteoglycan-like isoform X2 [Contarinia nasturtii]|uniref:basement membrane proteoglycan-like isoform X2 n=1 Tax=Contarinia nasturtii TaxID=265458 RepID=UPI0012D3A605|nr:basement membrane proteoglycan-like isoform X2 [Contarinia nasturtii]